VSAWCTGVGVRGVFFDVVVVRATPTRVVDRESEGGRNSGAQRLWVRSLWYSYVAPGVRDSIRRLVIESGWEGWRWSLRGSVEMCEGRFAHSSIEYCLSSSWVVSGDAGSFAVDAFVSYSWLHIGRE